jgi:predicted nuclease of predicted toxin-antitoxin system
VKFLLDETVSTFIPLLGDFLRENDYDVTSMSVIAPRTPDPEVLRLATQEGRTIITHDSGFSAYRFRDNLHMPYGVIFIEDSKHELNRRDSLFTRKMTYAIGYIAAQVAGGEYNLSDMVFTITQPTPFGPMRIRPKRDKAIRQVSTNMMYAEEQLDAEDEGVLISVPIESSSRETS